MENDGLIVCGIGAVHDGRRACPVRLLVAGFDAFGWNARVRTRAGARARGAHDWRRVLRRRVVRVVAGPERVRGALLRVAGPIRAAFGQLDAVLADAEHERLAEPEAPEAVEQEEHERLAHQIDDREAVRTRTKWRAHATPQEVLVRRAPSTGTSA